MTAVHVEPPVDDFAVELRVLGHRNVPLTRTETALAWSRMEAQGRKTATIAHLLDVDVRTVSRWRSGGVRPQARPAVWR